MKDCMIAIVSDHRLRLQTFKLPSSIITFLVRGMSSSVFQRIQFTVQLVGVTVQLVGDACMAACVYVIVRVHLGFVFICVLICVRN